MRAPGGLSLSALPITPPSVDLGTISYALGMDLCRVALLYVRNFFRD